MTLLLTMPFTITSFIILYDDGGSVGGGSTEGGLTTKPVLRAVRLYEVYKLLGPPGDVPER